MRAQKVEDPSMEDILSSIRKIISEDDKEDDVLSSGQNSNVPESRAEHAGNDSERQPIAARNPAQQPGQTMKQSVSRPQNTSHQTADNQLPNHQSQGVRSPVQSNQANSNNGPVHQQKPQISSERREYLDLDSPAPQPRQPAPTRQTSAQPAPVFAEKPNPMIRPAVQTSPGGENRGSETSTQLKAPVNPAVVHQPDKVQNREIPGFVETKPPQDGQMEHPVKSADRSAGNKTVETDEPLHPAIANAKSYVSIQSGDQSKRPDPSREMTETPVFSTPQSSIDVPVEKLISPDNMDRREVDERRNHPMRRGVDRDENEIRKELMSSSTTDSVHSAFEQLKNMTTENLDGNVRELIRPMLREWLDNNLPSMVERLVRDEIERVSRGE